MYACDANATHNCVFWQDVYLRPRAAVEHRGPSIHSGHYVCHVDEAHGWLTLDDEDVTEHSTLNRAYIICFEMVIFILYDTWDMVIANI